MTAKEVLSVRFAYYIAITNINAICKEAPSYMQVGELGVMSYGFWMG